MTKGGPGHSSWINGPFGLGLKLVLTALVTWLILRGVGLQVGDIRAIDLAAFDVSAPWLMLSLLLLFSAFAASAWLWRGLVAALGGSRIPIKEALAIVLTSNLGRYIPGKLFQLAGLAWLSNRSGVRPSTATAAAVLGQALHLLAAALIGGGLVTQSGAIPGRWGIGGLTLVLLFALVLSWKGGLAKFTGWILKRRNEEGPSALGEVSFMPWLAGYAANWIVLGLAFFALMKGIGVDTSLTLAVTAFAAAYLLGYLTLFAPAGIGVREGFLVVFLGPAIGQSPALAVAAAQRLWITVAELAGALIGWPALRGQAGPQEEGAGP
ncbi:MAG: lysylphosphatidylglycerol synthase domain-containing protein [Longimicrobiales bacterium]